MNPIFNGLTRAQKVKLAMDLIENDGYQPSPGRIQEVLEETVTHDLNGRDSRVYGEEMQRRGYIRVVSAGGRTTWRSGPLKRIIEHA